jgi:hypothetical protein
MEAGCVHSRPGLEIFVLEKAFWNFCELAVITEGCQGNVLETDTTKRVIPVHLADRNLTKRCSSQGGFDIANAIPRARTVDTTRQTTCLCDKVEMVKVINEAKVGVGIGGANERCSVRFTRQYRSS